MSVLTKCADCGTFTCDVVSCFFYEEEVVEKELIPCPFCKETESLHGVMLPTTGDGEAWKAIKCTECGAQGPMSKDGLEANRLWNARPTTER